SGSWPTGLVGSTPDIQQVRNWKVTHGRFYNDDDIKGLAPVCLLGQTVRRKLFPDKLDPVDEWIRVGHIQLRVIGVLGSKGRSPTGADQDDQVFVPITTLQRRIVGEERIVLLLAGARSQSVIDSAKEQIIKVLRRQHHLKSG